jgi:hypothetical protein
MTDPTTGLSSPDVQRAVQALHNHLAVMNQQIAQAHDIQGLITQGIVADAGSTFNRQLDAWVGTAQGIIGQYETLLGDLTNASNVITRASSDAVDTARHFTVGDTQSTGVYAQLAGN